MKSFIQISAITLIIFLQSLALAEIPVPVEPMALESVTLLQQLSSSEKALKNLEQLRADNFIFTGLKQQLNDVGVATAILYFNSIDFCSNASFSITGINDLVFGSRPKTETSDIRIMHRICTH